MTIQASLSKQDEADKKGIFLMGMRLEDQQKVLTKSQIQQKAIERLHEFYGEPPELNLAE